MNQSIHALDLMIHFAGSKPAEVYGHAALVGHERIEVEDTAAGVVKFANGVFGVIEASTCCQPGWPLEVEVSGTRGTAVTRGTNLVKWAFADKDPMDEEAEKVIAETEANIAANAADSEGFAAKNHQIMIEEMITKIRTGAGNVIDGESAKLGIELVCGLYESSKSGKPVKFA
jgi:predicted dehydrogenase